MRRVAVLIRAVNVGGTGKLPMAELKAFLADIGYDAPQTLLASGNAVVATDEACDAVEARVEREAKARLGKSWTVLARDAGDLDAVIAGDPFAEAARERPSQLLVTFGRAAVPAALLAALAEAHDGAERVAAVGRELVIDYAGRMSESKLDQSMRRLKFPGTNTARNWNTVVKLRAMLG